MSSPEPEVHLTAQDLSARIRAETVRYGRYEARDDRCSFELIRRAVVERDGEAWQALLEVYHDLVLSWCLRSGANPSDGDEAVGATWVKFWHSYTADKLANAEGSTSAALGYLKLCARSVVLDEARHHARLVSWDERQDDAEDRAGGPPEIDLDRVDRPAFWRLVGAHLRDERERLLVYLTYEIGLRPAEIQRHRPELFPTVQDVYRMTRNILDRLSRSKPLAAWLSTPAD